MVVKKSFTSIIHFYSDYMCHFVNLLSFARSYLRKIMWLNFPDFLLTTKNEALSHLLAWNMMTLNWRNKIPLKIW